MEPTIVTVSEGKLQGTVKESVRGGKYLSFQGIPFAKPPVGNLRFKAPEKPEPWTGIRMADKEAPSCSSRDFRTGLVTPNASEDCLYLNVYTPADNKTQVKKPVMFWVHGGGFQVGSSSTECYGPEYLVTEDVVLVTSNYRLGAFGFLSLGNEKCPGNNGLRDLIMALEWVQRNIENFNGDHKNVTLFGHSAGGALTSCLLVSPKAAGLFQKGIVMSGVSNNPWAMATRARELAYLLAEQLGQKASNDDELLAFLKTVPADDITEKGMTIQADLEPEDRYLLWLPFRPVVEVNHPGAVITQKPIDRTNQIPDIPLMLGTANVESLVIFLGTTVNEINEIKTDEEIDFIISKVFNRSPKASYPQNIRDQVRKRYTPHDSRQLLDLLSYIYVEKGVNDITEILRADKKRKSETFLYRFCYSGQCNFFKPLSRFPNIDGAAHGDELGYLFTNTLFPLLAWKANKTDQQTVATITKAWTDFAKFGDPWSAVKNKTNDHDYIKITNTLSLEKSFLQSEREFWEKIEAALK